MNTPVVKVFLLIPSEWDRYLNDDKSGLAAINQAMYLGHSQQIGVMLQHNMYHNLLKPLSAEGIVTWGDLKVAMDKVNSKSSNLSHSRRDMVTKVYNTILNMAAVSKENYDQLPDDYKATITEDYPYYDPLYGKFELNDNQGETAEGEQNPTESE